jgi:antitoxin VapB
MKQIAKVFQNGRSQAIRIPKEFRVNTKEVYIEKVGDTLIIKPKKENRWEDFFSLLEQSDTSGFLEERNQPPLDKKELF